MTDRIDTKDQDGNDVQIIITTLSGVIHAFFYKKSRKVLVLTFDSIEKINNLIKAF